MKSRWLPLSVVLLGAAVLFSLLFGGSRAGATGLPSGIGPGNYGYNMDDSARSIFTGVSACYTANCQKSRNSFMYVYVPNGLSAFNVTLDHGCFVKGIDTALFYGGAGGNYEELSASTYTAYSMYYGQSLGGDPTTIVPNLGGGDLMGVTTKQPGVCNPGSGPNISRTINFNPASAPLINIKGAGYHVLVFRGRANTSFFYYNQYRVFADSGVMIAMAATSLGFTFTDSNGITTTETAYTTVASTSVFGSQNWKFYTEFAPPCQADGSNKAYSSTFRAFDSDVGVYQAADELRFKIIELDRATGNFTGRVVRDQALTGGNEATEDFTDTYYANYKYEILIYGIKPINSQQFKLPFDQIYALGGECTSPEHIPSGSITAANCATISGNFSDQDYAGPYRIDVHFQTGPPYNNTTTVYTDGANNWSVTVPDAYKFTGAINVWVDGLGKNSAGADADWVALGGSPVAIGPCKSSACNLIQGKTNSGAFGGNIGYDGVYQVNRGDSLTMKLTYQNTAPASGGYTWTTGSGNQQVRVGTDGPYGPRNDFGGVIRPGPDTPGASVAPGGTASYSWSRNPTVDVAGDYKIKFQMVHEGVEWFAPNGLGNGNCEFTIRVILPEPIIECTLKPGGTVEIGTPYYPEATVEHQGPAYAPDVDRLIVTFTVAGSQVGTYQNSLKNGLTVTARSDGPYTNLTAGDYNMSAQGIAYAGPYTINFPCPGISSSVITEASFPYLKAYGSDIWAGGSFDGDCATAAGGVYAYAKADGLSSSGSAGQLGVMALLNIKGFYSASLKNIGSTTPIMGSSFSNTAGDITYGGAFGGAGACMPDYYTKTQETTGIAVKGNADFPPPSINIPAQPAQPAVYSTTYKPMFRWSYVGGTSTYVPGPRGTEGYYTYAPLASQTTDGYTYCTRFDNYLETHPVWSDNWLCSLEPINFFTEALKETNMAPYTLINEPWDPAWNNSYVGIIPDTKWSYNGNLFPADPDQCVNITEPGDPAWINGDNYLCAQPKKIVTLITPEIPAIPAQTLPGGFDAGKSRYMLTGAHSIAGLNIPIGSQVAIYVDGNVTITGNITYDGPAATSDALPYLAIIARGNIYIEPGVDRIDGLLIAQPRDLNSPTDGRIYTCAPSGAPPDATNIYTLCSAKQLVVNGALIAQQVKFGRTFKSLKDSYSLEAPAYATGTGTNAAEVINYSPEMYLAPSPLRDPNLTTSRDGIYGKYDAAFSLPPVY